MGNTVTCANCGQTWDVQHLPGGASFTCQCSTIVCLPNSPAATSSESVAAGPENNLESELVEVVAPRQVTAESLLPIDKQTPNGNDDPYSSENQVKPAMLHSSRPRATGDQSTHALSTTARLRLVNQGVQLVFIGILISLLAMLLLAIPWSIALFVFVGIIQMGAGMVEIAGLIYCLFAPPASGSRPFGIVALSCNAGGSLLLKLIEIISSASSEEFDATPLTMFALVTHMAGTAFFLFYLRQLAHFTGQRSEADEAKFLAIFMCVLAGVGLVLGLFIPILGMGSLVVFAALFIAHLFWFFQFMGFLDKLKFRKPFVRKKNSKQGWTDARTGE